MGFVADAIDTVANAVVDTVGNIVDTVVQNPLAVIAAVAAPELAVAMGVSAPVAAAALSATSTAIQGGGIGDIIKSGAAGGLGSVVGASAGAAAQNYAAANIESVAASTVGKVAGSAAGSATAGLVNTGDIGTALQMGIVGGGTAGALEAGKSVLDSLSQGTTTTGVRGSSNLQPGDQVPTSPFGTTETVAQTSPQWSPNATFTTTFDTMPSSTYSPGWYDPNSKVAKAGEKLAGQYISASLSDILGLTPGTPSTFSPSSSTSASASSASPASSSVMGGGGSTGSSALAQALNVGDPGTSLFGKQGGPTENVWNQASLRNPNQDIGGTNG